MFTRRHFGQSVLAMGATALGAPAMAQSGPWPSRPIKVVIPYSPGVGDQMFRLFDQALQQRLKQPFVVDNKPGANGNIGTADAVRATPDGYTLLMAPTGNYAVNQHLSKLNFDAVTQLEPIVAMADAPLIAVVGAGVQASSLRQLADLVKAPGSRFNFGSPAAGSPSHLAGASFSLAHGSQMEHIAFKGIGPMVQSMLAGDVQVGFPTLSPILSHVKTGRIRPLAVLSKQRLPELPNVPTAAEAGFPDFLFGNWWALSAPKGTDRAVIERLGTEIRQMLGEPAIKAKLADMGNVPLNYGPAEAATFIRGESAKYKTLIERTGIRLD